VQIAPQSTSRQGSEPERASAVRAAIIWLEYRQQTARPARSS
jgi:hypothetical protein